MRVIDKYSVVIHAVFSKSAKYLSFGVNTGGNKYAVVLM